MVVWSCAARRVSAARAGRWRTISQSPLTVNWSSEKRLGLVTSRLLLWWSADAEVLLGPQTERGRRRSLENRVGGNPVAGELAAAVCGSLQRQTGDARKIAVPPRLDGNRAGHFHAAPLAVAFVVDEEECAVAHNGSARGPAELVTVQPARPSARKKLRASKTSLRQNSNSEPCSALVPDLVMRLIWPKAAWPISAE